MLPIQHAPRSSWFALIGVAGWEHWQAADGPVAQLLVHQVADPLARLRGAERRVWFSARLQLRDGRVWALRGRAERADLQAALSAAAAVLTRQPCIATHFAAIEGLMARALAASGRATAVIELDRRPGLAPRAAIGAAQLCRLALHALNIDRAAAAQTTLIELPAIVAECFRQACAPDHAKVKAWQAALQAPGQAAGASLGASLFLHNYLAARD